MTGSRWNNATRVALRSLVAARWNALAAVVVLSVAAAAGHAVTAIWDSVIERRLSWRNADEIVELSVEAIRENRETTGETERPPSSLVTESEVATLADSATSLLWVGAWSVRSVVVGGGAHARLIGAAELPPGAFEALGAVPSAGRVFDDADHRAVVSGTDDSPVVILREDLAAALFGTASDAIGEIVDLGPQGTEVIGVMPRDFVFPDPRMIAWVPRAISEASGAVSWRLPAHARLAPGATPETAAAEATAILRRADLRTEDERVVLSPLTEDLTASIRPTLEVLRAGALLLLLVAAASVASLRLSQALSEQRTSGIRRALGATPGDEIAAAALRIVLLAAVVAAGALAVSTYLLPLLRTYGAHLLFAQDWNASAETALTAFVAAFVAVALAEAPSLFEILRERSAAVTGGTRGAHGRRPFLMPLLAAGTAAATVILVATAVLAGSAWALLAGRGGYSDADLGVLTLDFGGRGADLAPGSGDQRRILDELVERIESLPAVESAGYGESLPDDPSGTSLHVAGPSAEDAAPIAIRKVSTGMLGALRIPILRGRGLLDSDRHSGEAIAVVDRGFASRAAEDPVGQLVQVGPDRVRVVGVAAEVLPFPVRARRSVIYRPYVDESVTGGASALLGVFLAGMTASKTEVVARFRDGLSPERLSTLAEIPKAVDPSLRVLDSESVRSRRTGLLGSSALTSVVLVVFAAAGLLLTVVGVIGHISDTTAREAQPNAVRLALGAEPVVVVWQVARRTGIAAGAGIGLGLLLGWLLARGIGSRIPWVETGDLFLYLGPAALAALLMAAAGLHAGLRASRANPWALLRSL